MSPLEPQKKFWTSWIHVVFFVSIDFFGGYDLYIISTPEYYPLELERATRPGGPQVRVYDIGTVPERSHWEQVEDTPKFLFILILEQGKKFAKQQAYESDNYSNSQICFDNFFTIHVFH